MASIYVLDDVFDEVKAFLAGKGSQHEHYFGSEHLQQNSESNFYVWVPQEIQRTGGAAGGRVDEHEIAFFATHVFFVLCVAEEHRHAYGMAQSLQHALRQVVPTAMLSLKALEWQFPKEGEALMGRGRNLAVPVEIMHVPFLDAYVDVPAHSRGTVSEPEQPNAPFTTPTSVVITSSITSDIDVNGSPTLTDTVTD